MLLLFEFGIIYIKCISKPFPHDGRVNGNSKWEEERFREKKSDMGFSAPGCYLSDFTIKIFLQNNTSVQLQEQCFSVII